jgi:hypothetical protein
LVLVDGRTKRRKKGNGKEELIGDKMRDSMKSSVKSILNEEKAFPEHAVDKTVQNPNNNKTRCDDESPACSGCEG